MVCPLMSVSTGHESTIDRIVRFHLFAPYRAARAGPVTIATIARSRTAVDKADISAPRPDGKTARMGIAVRDHGSTRKKRSNGGIRTFHPLPLYDGRCAATVEAVAMSTNSARPRSPKRTKGATLANGTSRTRRTRAGRAPRPASPVRNVRIADLP